MPIHMEMGISWFVLPSSVGCLPYQRACQKLLCYELTTPAGGFQALLRLFVQEFHMTQGFDDTM